ncbi:unnamed protein product [Phytophthora fragariaefolia]|uniref:Unnamed protein product n=1 Tax=Phytophthora fragariaefolia TaxID=1490495 RepID=A0A9W6XVL7_9STRA|nr:unnamed protein product [Phytophthora fragariaefolia]
MAPSPPTFKATTQGRGGLHPVCCLFRRRCPASSPGPEARAEVQLGLAQWRQEPVRRVEQPAPQGPQEAAGLGTGQVLARVPAGLQQAPAGPEAAEEESVQRRQLQAHVREQLASSAAT